MGKTKYPHLGKESLIRKKGYVSTNSGMADPSCQNYICIKNNIIKLIYACTSKRSNLQPI